MKNRTDFITGLVLALFSLWYLYLAQGIRIFPGMGKAIVNSQTMPKVWAVCLLLLALALMSRAFRRGVPDADARGARKTWGEILLANSEVILTFAALFAYAAVLNFLGFIISSALYICAQTLILMPKDRRSFLKAAGLGVAASLLAWALFVKWLDVLLPAGSIFG